MDATRWKTVEDIFFRALDSPEDGRGKAVAEMCAGDEEVLAEVTAMLSEDARDNALLDGGLDQAARTVMDLGRIPSLVEKQIGPYRVLRLLGEGGMGVVYLAERIDIGGQVAIKLLRDAWLSPMRRERFRIEQNTLARLNHHSIARIYDANTLEDGTPWFVMEYAEGLPLGEYLKKQDLAMRDRLELFRRISEAVEYAHSHAIIHRDLKPSNILVDSAGEVKLLDFGIAKQLNREESSRQSTATGLRLMTLAYAAPEQFSGGVVGLYTDVYALGVLLYELVTARLPRRRHTGDAEDAVDHWLTERPSSVVSRERPELRRQLTRAEWADLDVLTRKALETEVVRRYSTANALLRDLTALIEGRPLDARPAEWTYVLSKFVRRNRRPLLAAAVTVLLVAATAIFYTVRLQLARDVAIREAARAQRIQQFTQELFDGGDASAGPSAELKAVDLLDRGRAEAAGLGADPEMQADLEATLGGIYQKLGKLDTAEPLLADALAQRTRLHGSSDLEVAKSLMALGLLRKDQGKLDAAEQLARQGLTMCRNTPSASPSDVAAALVAYGSILEVRARYEEARKAFEEALKTLPTNAANDAQRAETLLELANVAFYQGRYDDSAAFNRRALDIDRRIFGEQHPAVAEELNNFGAIEQNRGNLAASEAYYRQSLAIVEHWYGPMHAETAANLTALAQTLCAEERYSEAQSLLERALAIQEQGAGPVRATVATTLNQMGIVAFDAKQWDEARGYFNQAIDTWRKIYGDQHPYIANAISNLGSICQQQKDYACAEKYYREAVKRFDAASPGTVNNAIAHIKLGRTLLSEQKFAEAETHSLAGYKYLVQHAAPTNSYLGNARHDLAAIYDGLHRPEDAARFRAEMAQANQVSATH